MMSAILDEHGVAFAAPIDTSEREFRETWLYYHLTEAGDARRRMDRAPTWGDYEDARQIRAHALERASKHYRALLNLGGQMEQLLARMALAEGFTP
jgi:hypothetical protein